MYFFRFSRLNSSRLFGFAFALASVVLSTQPLTAQNKLNQRLNGTLRGQAAIAELGDRLPAVAQAHGVSPQVLANLFQLQKDLAIDPDGALLFTCQGLAASGSAVKASEPAPDGGTGNAISVNTGDALRLHSLPGAQRVIYLDFDGHTTSGTRWNSTFTGGSQIVSQPFDLDGSPWSFNATELNVIRGIWQRVAEDFAPFAIDVTTEDPGVEALRRSSSGDSNYGVRVVISPSNWYNSGAGGVAYVGSFNWDSDTPCYVFSGQLANMEKYMAESASHEIGHSLGLYHDGQSGGTEYYAGHGNWAPIMGVGYYASITQFSRGEYANANNTQDDFAVISTFAPFANDDHDGSFSTNYVLAGPVVADGGTIEREGDVDMFKFSAGAGWLALDIRGPSAEPNLDIRAELFNSAGQSIQASDPSGTNATIAATISAGTYFLRISGVGAGSAWSTGYSTYGSVGNYIITGVIPTGTVSLPSAPSWLNAAAGNGQATLDWGSVSSATSYRVKRSTSSGGPFTIVGDGLTSTQFTDGGLSNGTTYYYVTTALNSSGESSISPQAVATPAGGGTTSSDAFVTSASFGTARNNFTGWVGMRIVVGGSPMSVTHLGRIVAPGNSGQHAVKLVRSSDGVDVPGGATVVATSGMTAGQYAYGALSSAVTLGAGETYYVVSQEAAGGDQWYDMNTQVTAASAGSVSGAVYGISGWYAIDATNRSYGPVNLKYTTGTVPIGGDGSSFVTSVSAAGTRNDFSGWVGMRFVVGGSAISVTHVGRLVVPGNNGLHAVKFVRASDGSDVPGGYAIVSTGGAAAGQFQYATLSSAVTLNAGETYFLVSQEGAGGDQWYDWQTEVGTTSVASVSGGIYGFGSGSWYPVGWANRTYVPVTFKYSAAPPSGGTTTALVTSATGGSVRNDYNGWVGMRITVGGTPMSVSQLGRMVAPGNSGSHTVKLVRVSDGQDVPGGATTVSTSGAAAGQFQYGTLSSPVTLSSGESYFVVSQEFAGGDSWHDWQSDIATTSAASANAAVYGSGPGAWGLIWASNRSYGPVNLRYSGSGGGGGGGGSGTFVTGATPSAARNNYSGWVGMQITIGSSPITVTRLGRMVAPGNTGLHAVKIVRASDGGDESGGYAVVTTSGTAVGQFAYAALSSPVTLSAGTTYYIVSQEAAGGDAWYDWDTQISTSSVAQATSAIWGSGPGAWNAIGGGNRSYGAVSFEY
jgi:hypothetical protein